MRKHILISTFILLTAGCQPNSDGNLLSHNETDVFSRKLSDSGEVSVQTLQGHQVSKYDQTITAKQSLAGSLPQEQQVSQEIIRAKVFDAVVRLKMDLAGVTTPTTETNALEKLLHGPDGGVSFSQALKENKISFDLPAGADNGVEIHLLARAFKQAAVLYDFDQETQTQIYAAILNRSTLLAPIESQKVLAAVNGELLQNKANVMAEATALQFASFCPALSSFLSAGENFYEDKQYVLPLLIRNKLASIKVILKDEIAGCASGSIIRSQATLENVDTAIQAVTFDLTSLELYLSPANDFNWQEYNNFKRKAVLQEAQVPGQGRLSFSDVLCSLDGKPLPLRETAEASAGAASFEYVLDGVTPLMLERSASQRGLTLAFVAPGIKVTAFQGLTLTKIKPDTLVPAINLIPGRKQELSLSFKIKKDSMETHLQCRVEGH